MQNRAEKEKTFNNYRNLAKNYCLGSIEFFKGFHPPRPPLSNVDTMSIYCRCHDPANDDGGEMDYTEAAFDEDFEDDDEPPARRRGAQPTRSVARSRERRSTERVSYREDSDESDSDSHRATLSTPSTYEKILAMRPRVAGKPEEPKSEEEGEGDKSGGDSRDPNEYLVKLRDRAYCYCEWVTIEDIERDSGTHAKHRIKRFMHRWNNEVPAELLYGDGNFFDPAYLEIDRLVHVTMTKVLLPLEKRKVLIRNGIKSLVQKLSSSKIRGQKVIQIFLKPVKEDEDEAPGYHDIVKDPICFSEIKQLNADQGFEETNGHLLFALLVRKMFDNARLYNKDESNPVRFACEYLSLTFEEKFASLVEKINDSNTQSCPEDNLVDGKEVLPLSEEELDARRKHLEEMKPVPVQETVQEMSGVDSTVSTRLRSGTLKTEERRYGRGRGPVPQQSFYASEPLRPEIAAEYRVLRQSSDRMKITISQPPANRLHWAPAGVPRVAVANRLHWAPAGVPRVAESMGSRATSFVGTAPLASRMKVVNPVVVVSKTAPVKVDAVPKVAAMEHMGFEPVKVAPETEGMDANAPPNIEAVAEPVKVDAPIAPETEGMDVVTADAPPNIEAVAEPVKVDAPIAPETEGMDVVTADAPMDVVTADAPPNIEAVAEPVKVDAPIAPETEGMDVATADAPPNIEAVAEPVKVDAPIAPETEGMDVVTADAPPNIEAVAEPVKVADLDIASKGPVTRSSTRQATSGAEKEETCLVLIKWKSLPYTEATWEIEDFLDKHDSTALLLGQFYLRNTVSKEKLNRAKLFGRKGVRGLRVKVPSSKTHYISEPYSIRSGGRLLRSYQVAGVNWMLQHHYKAKNTILADEMGLGKTIQTIAFLHTLATSGEKIKGPFLIVAPLSTLSHWKREIAEHSNLNVVVYHDAGGADGRHMIRRYEFPYFKDLQQNFANSIHRKRVSEKHISAKSSVCKFDVLVTSYEVAVSDEKHLAPIGWEYVVVDEAHRLKNKAGKLLGVLQQYAPQRRLLLSGTPLQNDVKELWSLLHFIAPETFPNEDRFLSDYADIDYNADTAAKLTEAVSGYMLRRKKEQVEKNIPPKKETIIDCELTTLQKQVYRALFERNRTHLLQTSTALPKLLNLEMQLRKSCNHPFLIEGVEQHAMENSTRSRADLIVENSGKMVLLDKLLPKLRREGHKVLVFSQMTKMLDILQELFLARGYPIERIDGSVKQSDRQTRIDRFSHPKSDSFLFLLSTRAGGLGINLTAADTVIIYDSDWNPQNDLQAQARCHRIGQTAEVKVYRLLTARTYEATMFERASRKLGLERAVITKGLSNSSRDGAGTPPPGTASGRTTPVPEDDPRMNKKQMERLLRFGAYVVSDEDDAKAKVFCESDIEELLKRSQVVEYGTSDIPNALSEGFSFEKHAFSLESGTSVEVDDPLFWKKVLGEDWRDTLHQRLVSGEALASEESKEEFLTDLFKLAEEVIRGRMEGKAMAERAESVTEMLMIVTATKRRFSAQQLGQAGKCLDNLQRPRRTRRASRSPAPRKQSTNEAIDEESSSDSSSTDSEDEPLQPEPKKKAKPKKKATAKKKKAAPKKKKKKKQTKKQLASARRKRKREDSDNDENDDTSGEEAEEPPVVPKPPKKKVQPTIPKYLQDRRRGTKPPLHRGGNGRAWSTRSSAVKEGGS